tara:strand:- start:867 stop:1730 length:864 start_codon:yes stop_codon:yes gene_type:complete
MVSLTVLLKIAFADALCQASLRHLFSNIHSCELRNMPEILQTRIPYDVSTKKNLPGIAPLAADGWLVEDEAFAGQMGERDRLISVMPERVFADAGAAPEAKQEVLDEVLGLLRSRPSYTVNPREVIRPDGVVVPLDGDPLLNAAQLVQEDLCLHEKRGGEHVLTAAVLCFPASWRLDEKVGRPLGAVHATVDEYTADIGKRVQRLFDGIQPGRPVWRFNLLQYVRPDLFQPRSEKEARSADEDYGSGAYTRTEHQSLVRMPKSGAVLFAIHTYVVKQDDKLGQGGGA